MKGIPRIAIVASLISIFSFQFSISQAQITHSNQGQVDKTAAAVIKKAAAKFNGNVGFGVTATVLDGQQKQTLKQSAQVLYCKGHYRVTVADQEIICDGTTVWQWNKSAKEVVVNNMSSDDMNLFNPALLLANYDKNFRAKYIRTDDDGTAVVDLQPRSARSFHKIRLFIVEKSGLLRRMEVHKFDSGREVYIISNFKNAGTPASQFTFDATKHPGVEVIDMR
jgi:chaperone LolA